MKTQNPITRTIQGPKIKYIPENVGPNFQSFPGAVSVPTTKWGKLRCHLTNLQIGHARKGSFRSIRLKRKALSRGNEPDWQRPIPKWPYPPKRGRFSKNPTSQNTIETAQKRAEIFLKGKLPNDIIQKNTGFLATRICRHIFKGRTDQYLKEHKQGTAVLTK